MPAATPTFRPVDFPVLVSTETVALPTFRPATAVPLMVLTPVPTAPLPENPPLYRSFPTAPPSSGHPTGTSGLCHDGTYTSAAHRQGACSWHGGIAQWWGP